MSTPPSPPRWPKVFLDEDVRAEVRRVVDSWRAPVQFARELIGTGQPDGTVVAFASSESAVLITCNANHFLALAKKGRTRGLSLLILLRCGQLHTAARLSAARDLLELELERRGRRGAHGTTIEIHGNHVLIHR